MYSIRNLKTWDSREGGGFQVDLLRDGKAVAQVTNRGDGGAMDFRWSEGQPTVEVKALKYDGSELSYKGTDEEALLWAHCRTLPPYEEAGFTGHMDPDMLVSNLVDDLELERQVKRWLKSGTTAVVDGEVLRWKMPPTRENIDAVRKKHPSANVLNLLTVADAVKAARAAQ